MSRIRFIRPLIAVGFALLFCAAGAQAQQYGQPDDGSQPPDAAAPPDAAQAPGRVARLAYLSGQVQFAPAGEDDWGSVDINRPMVIGDRLLTGDDGRAALELGDASVRIDHDSAFDFLNLDQDNVQLELSQGTLNLAVRQLADGENFEVDTPTVAFVAATPGVYRIDNDPSGTGSMVTVFQGSGTVYGENGASRQVTAGNAYRFNDSALASVDTTGVPQADDFDRFCDARDASYQRYAQQQQQQQYVPPDMIGGEDLAQYGQWNSAPDYGHVWYPNNVPAGWAPYRYGHWAWVEPWGWTWVDNQPWGFAPFHYGRWAYVGNRWGWVPGQVNVRPVYAPALVAFVGGSGWSVSMNTGGGGPIGWFPLGPRDVYVPWFHASRGYFTQVNVTNIRRVYVNRTVINNYYGDYSSGRAPRHAQDYAYRNLPNAVTAVPRDVFTGARPVHSAALRLNRNQLARSEVALRPGVSPGRASLGLQRPVARPAILKGRQPFTRPVVARHAPPPRPVAFAAREKVIDQQGGQPLTPTQMRTLQGNRPTTAARTDRVKLVPRQQQRAPTPTAPEHGFRNQIHPIPVNRGAQPPARSNATGAMPSSRFAHGERPATLPRATEIRPAEQAQQRATTQGRLPNVEPVERAHPPASNVAAQQRQQTAMQSEQRARTQQLQQQRDSQQQAQQRIRAEQAGQQRAAQMQQQQQRQTQVQQQRQAQNQQREMQQQRQAQVQQQRQAQDQQREMQQQRRVQVQQQREVQRDQQTRQREQPRAPQPRERARSSSDRHDDSDRHPPASSGNLMR